jgi:hypothetical protein
LVASQQRFGFDSLSASRLEVVRRTRELDFPPQRNLGA